MRYDEYLRRGYGIGSGAVESAHKQVVHARFRQAGMRWSEAGARRLLALRLLLLNVEQRCAPVGVDLAGAMRHAWAMRRPAEAEVPTDLRTRLEAARLDLLVLFRALDRMDLTPEEIPQRLIRQLFELDADYAEALWALDQPPGALDLQRMLRDTLAALEQLPEASHRLRRARVIVTVYPRNMAKRIPITVAHGDGKPGFTLAQGQ